MIKWTVPEGWSVLQTDSKEVQHVLVGLAVDVHVDEHHVTLHLPKSGKIRVH